MNPGFAMLEERGDEARNIGRWKQNEEKIIQRVQQGRYAPRPNAMVQWAKLEEELSECSSFRSIWTLATVSSPRNSMVTQPQLYNGDVL